MSSTAATTTATTSASSGGAAGGSTTSPCPQAFAGCTTFEDHTADTEVTIDFGGDGGLAYSPKCIQVRASTTSIKFAGDFTTHPLTEACAPPQSVTFSVSDFQGSVGITFDVAGTYGYYCAVHGSPNGTGMAGAFEVVP